MIEAVLLAAGQSRRMGQPKMNLPWKDSTVLGHILATLLEAGINGIVVVLGDTPIQNLPENLAHTARFYHNPQASQSGMLSSLQVGLRVLLPETSAALVTLGDQPQLEVGVVRSLLKYYQSNVCPLLVPSYQNRRGHPWLLGRALWNEVDSLDRTKTMRDFLNSQAKAIRYLNINSASILQDLDTPADYARFHPS